MKSNYRVTTAISKQLALLMLISSLFDHFKTLEMHFISGKHASFAREAQNPKKIFICEYNYVNCATFQIAKLYIVTHHL